MVLRAWSADKWLVCLLLVVSVTIGATPGQAAAQELSGTIRYTGSKGGQVSDSRPILIALQSQIGAKTEVDRQSVTTNGGAFTLHTPVAGQYYLYYLVDVINIRDGSGFPGEPAGIYNRTDGCTFEGDLITVPQSGLDLEFDDSCIFSGIGGTVTYTGGLSGRGIIVQAFTDPNLNTAPAATYIYARNGGYYGIITLDTDVYYLRALLDVNGDGIFEPGEPFAICASPIQAGPDQTGVNIAFGDGGASTCVISPPPVPTPTATSTPPPTTTATPTGTSTSQGTCVGDCGTDGSVTVDEILTMVNIALGTADIEACRAGDKDHSGMITVDEILTAVTNALTSCPGAPIINVAGTWSWNETQIEIISGRCSALWEVKNYTITIIQNGDNLAFMPDACVASGSITGSIEGQSISLSGAIQVCDGGSAQFTISLTVSEDGSALTGTLHQASSYPDYCTGTFGISATKT
jgi:hypothetical protein